MARRSPYVALFKSGAYQKVLLFHSIYCRTSNRVLAPQLQDYQFASAWSIYQPVGIRVAAVSDNGLCSPSSHVTGGSSQAFDSLRKAALNQN